MSLLDREKGLLNQRLKEKGRILLFVRCAPYAIGSARSSLFTLESVLPYPCTQSKWTLDSLKKAQKLKLYSWRRKVKLRKCLEDLVFDILDPGTGGNGTARKRLQKDVRRGSSLDGGTLTGFHKMPIMDKEKITGSFFRAYIEGCPFFSN